MSNESLPSITTRSDDPGSVKSSVNKAKDTALFTRAIDGMMDLIRIENNELDKIDLESMIDKIEKMVLKKKKRCQGKKMYTQYQNLWTAFVANNISNEYDDVTLVRHTRKILTKTLWRV